MTGGQYSPLSGYGTLASTAPYTNIDHSFDIVDLARAAGATFVARSTTYHAQQLPEIIKEAITHKGFPVVDFPVTKRFEYCLFKRFFVRSARSLEIFAKRNARFFEALFERFSLLFG